MQQLPPLLRVSINNCAYTEISVCGLRIRLAAGLGSRSKGDHDAESQIGGTDLYTVAMLRFTFCQVGPVDEGHFPDRIWTSV